MAQMLSVEDLKKIIEENYVNKRELQGIIERIARIEKLEMQRYGVSTTAAHPLSEPTGNRSAGQQIKVKSLKKSPKVGDTVIYTRHGTSVLVKVVDVEKALLEPGETPSVTIADKAGREINTTMEYLSENPKRKVSRQGKDAPKGETPQQTASRMAMYEKNKEQIRRQKQASSQRKEISSDIFIIWHSFF